MKVEIEILVNATGLEERLRDIIDGEIGEYVEIIVKKIEEVKDR